MLCTELTDSVACYVQFVIGHDESNAKGTWVAKNLKSGYEREREREVTK